MAMKPLCSNAPARALLRLLGPQRSCIRLPFSAAAQRNRLAAAAAAQRHVPATQSLKCCAAATATAPQTDGDAAAHHAKSIAILKARAFLHGEHAAEVAPADSVELPPEWRGLIPLPPNTPPDPGETKAQSRERRALWRALNQKVPWLCPACEIPLYKVEVLKRHVQQCCPDNIRAEALEGLQDSDDATVRAILAEGAVREAALWERGLNLGFRERDAEGTPIRRTTSEVAGIIGLPMNRARRMMKRAMKTIPLQHDHIALDVIFEDAHMIAVNKPPGLLTAPKHRYVGGSTLNRLLPYLGTKPWVIHRLDMDTSGVVVFGKSLAATRHLHQQFRARTVRKTYLAAVAGVPAEAQFLVDAPIGRRIDDKQLSNTPAEADFLVDALIFCRVSILARITGPDGQHARTGFEVLSSNPAADLTSGIRGDFQLPAGSPDRGAALVRCSPVTGRTHQIRVHLGHAGHPIIGDDFYGVKGPWMTRQALHAAELELVHPGTEERICIRAPLLSDFQSALQQLGLAYPREYAG